MVTGPHRIFGCAANFLRGRKCVFCGAFRVNRTRRGYVKCRTCRRQKSLAKLRREIAILQGFSQQVPAYRLAHDLGVDPPRSSVGSTRNCGRHCSTSPNWKAWPVNSRARSNWTKPISADDGRGAGAKEPLAKAWSSGCWSGMGACRRRWWNMWQRTPSWPTFRPGSVYYTDAFRGYQSLRR